MSVLNRSDLESSPLADLHAIASELGLDGYRRLRKADLVDKILGDQGSEDGGAAEPAAEEERPARRPRGGRGRGAARAARDKDEDESGDDDDAGKADDADDDAVVDASADQDDQDDDADERPARARRSRRGGRGRGDSGSDGGDRGGRSRGGGDGGERGGRGGGDRDRDRDRSDGHDRDVEDRLVEGVVELLGNGSGFVRVSPPDPSDDDVYVSAAQVRRCELVSGDRVAGPVRAPRRSERYPSLVRVDTINGSPADQVSEGTHFDELAAAFPTQRLALGGDDATLKAIEWLTPIGRGSRVTIVGAARAGKSEALKSIAIALTATEGLEVSLVLAGVRPEEVTEWRTAPPAPLEPAAATTFAASADAQGQAVERALETAKRIAARGGDAVLLIDTLDGVHPSVAHKALAAARDIPEGGSLTVIATSTKPVGGETTVIALDAMLTSTGRFPALDLVASGTLRPALLVGEAGADAIAQARAAALG